MQAFSKKGCALCTNVCPRRLTYADLHMRNTNVHAAETRPCSCGGKASRSRSRRNALQSRQRRSNNAVLASQHPPAGHTALKKVKQQRLCRRPAWARPAPQPPCPTLWCSVHWLCSRRVQTHMNLARRLQVRLTHCIDSRASTLPYGRCAPLCLAMCAACTANCARVYARCCRSDT